MAPRDRGRDKPWMMRTYSGHTSARASNQLYRTNLAKGQTGLSIAFDLPTQTGYDPDAPEADGRGGQGGGPCRPPRSHGRALRGHPPRGHEHVDDHQRHRGVAARALHRLRRGHRGGPPPLQGTTQNDIVKEYLSRGTYIFPPGPSRRLIVDMIAYTVREVPKWNPINVCSYHLQEAGATPVQEVAYALATAIGVLDAVRDSGKIEPSELPAVVGRISFFVNAGIRFVEETCKVRALTRLWDRICLERYGVEDPKLRRFRYGVQVNSLGLTEAQPENNVPRIVLEALGVTLSRDARARAIQLPAWNEALGLPRPWDQQWSLRIQQILAYRDRPARVRRHLRGLHGDRGEDGRARRGGGAGARGGPRARRRLRSRRGVEASPGAQPGRAGAAHRDGRARRGGGQLLHRDRALPARDRRRRR